MYRAPVFVLCGALAVAGAAAAWSSAPVFAAAVLVVWSMEWSARARPRTGTVVRSIYADLALIVLLERTADIANRAVAIAVLALLALIGLRAAAAVADAGRQRRHARAVAWRNVGLARRALQRVARPEPAHARAAWAPWISLPVYAGAVAACLGAWTGLIVLGAVASLGAAAAILGTVVRGWRELGASSADDVLDELAGALERLAPVIVLYVGAAPSAAGERMVGAWLSVLERLDQPVLVIVRGLDEFQRLSSGLPTVLVSRARQLNRLVPASVRLGLYPVVAMTNNHLLRLPGVADVFVGDADAVAVSRLSRIFDELWVSGPAACQRVLGAGVGIRAFQIRQVGAIDDSAACVDRVDAAVRAVVGTPATVTQ